MNGSTVQALFALDAARHNKSRFPHTLHLVWLGNGEPRDDKVLSKAGTCSRGIPGRQAGAVVPLGTYHVK